MFFNIDTSQFMPHGHCILWSPELLFPIVFSDIVIFCAYTTIPIGIFLFIKKRHDLTQNNKRLLYLFVVFIQLCGITHLISAYNYWHSAYVLEMCFKVVTAIVSAITAAQVFRLFPTFLTIPTPEKHQEIIDQLRVLNSTLEEKVQERSKTIIRQNQILETVLKGHPGAIVSYHPIFSENHQIVDFSNKFIIGDVKREAGLDVDEVITDSILTQFPEIKENGHFQNAIDAFNSNSTITEDPVYNSKTNRYHRVVIHKNADIDYVIVYFTDVTSRELMKIDSISNSKLAAIGELAGGVAHEINSPLQVVKGLNRIIERNTDKENEAISKALKDSNKIIDDMASIISNLKKLSQGANGTTKPLVLSKELDNALSFQKKRLNANGVQLILELNIDPETKVQINQTSFFQIITNILNNAIDAVDGCKTKKIIIETHQLEDAIEIKISNSGTLIPIEVQQRIFEPLFTTKEVGKGTGLGLSLSKKLAESMGAKLTMSQNDMVSFVLTVRNGEVE